MPPQICARLSTNPRSAPERRGTPRVCVLRAYPRQARSAGFIPQEHRHGRSAIGCTASQPAVEKTIDSDCLAVTIQSNIKSSNGEMLHFQINPHSGVPVYRQMIDQVKYYVASDA